MVVAVYLAGAQMFGGEEWFDDLVGWANIFALVVGGIALEALVSRRFERADARTARLSATLDELATRFGMERGNELSRMVAIDTDQEGARINLRFSRQVLQYQAAGGALAGEAENISTYFASLNPRRLVVVGARGSGKTTLALQLVVDLNRGRAPGSPIPVWLPATSFNGEASIDSWMVDALIAQGGVDKRTAKELVERHKVIPVVDGLDELDGEGTAYERAAAVVARLNSYFLEGVPATFVVTCRSSVYSALGLQVRDATVVEMEQVSPTDAVAYIQRRHESAAEEFDWHRVCDVLAGIHGPIAQARLAECLVTPWHISLALIAAKSGRRPDNLFLASAPGAPVIVRAKSDVHRELVRYFLPGVLHLNAVRRGQPRDAAVVLSTLRFMAQHLAAQRALGKPSDLRLDRWWLAHERWTRVAHQGVGALACVSGLVAIYLAVDGPRIWSVAAVEDYIRAYPHLDAAFSLAAVVVVVGLMGAVFVTMLRCSSKDPQAHSVSLRGLARLGALSLILVCSLVGVVVGLLVGQAVGVRSGLSLGSVRSLVVGGVAGGILAMCFGIGLAASRKQSQAYEPAAVVVNDAAYGLLRGVPFILVGGAGGTVAIGPQFGALVSLGAMLIYGMAWGSVASVRYFLACILLWARWTRIPIRFVPFLRWATAVGILRSTGASYQFRQREIEDALVAGHI
ncbi:NACHT domain-containing protein [Geodermatophilus normandii]|uniref:NACHT domain-containing protein n=1 Tax=Geodermatophilus normandii TaxID=1137989 RepID=UPI001472FEC2|nr:NACHT domain-containing protein [Geodermatophilus normandii]